MVLNRLALVVLLAACKQSLFAAGGDDGTSPDGTLPATCASPCVADAGKDYQTGPWRYLDDHKNRTWVAMNAAGPMEIGDGGNTIAPCAGSPACALLPGALLLTQASNAADPAIELTIATSQVVTVTLAAASAGAETVRLYRNSREDALYTTTTTANAVAGTTLTMDVIAGDRILVTSTGETAIQLFVSGTGAQFPSTCLMAVAFPPVTASTIANACGSTVSSMMTTDDDATQTAKTFRDTPGPYAELGTGGLLAQGQYYQGGSTLDRTGDTTTQMWIRQDAALDAHAAIYFSDVDLDVGGGLSIDVSAETVPQLEAFVCTNPAGPSNFVDGLGGDYPNDHAWHFVRVTYSNGTLALCLDGKKLGSKQLPALTTTQKPFIGKDVFWTPPGAWVSGAVDDVRVLRGALPCD